MEKWYEVAVSYKLGHGTETIETFDTLKGAKNYINNCDALEREYVDFVFIDRWYSEDGDSSYKDYDFDPIIKNRRINNEKK